MKAHTELGINLDSRGHDSNQANIGAIGATLGTDLNLRYGTSTAPKIRYLVLS